MTLKQSISPLFITGCMRSGTTYLYNKLSEHPQLLKIKGELNEEWTKIGGVDCSVYCHFADQTSFNESTQKAMLDLFQTEIEHSKSIFKHLERTKKLIEKQGGRIFYDWNNIIPMNKSTHLVNKISYVHTLFPKSKFIFIVRDIYAQSASLKVHFNANHSRTGFYFHKPISDIDCWVMLGNKKDNDYVNQPKFPGDFSIIPEMWIRLNKIALNELNKLPNEQVLFVNYEKLTTNQPTELKRIFDFLQLNKKHKDVEFKIAEKKLAYINTTTTGNPLEKWKSSLSEEEINTIQEIISRNQVDYNLIQKSIIY